MIWFGKSWGAPCCERELHVPTPVGRPCLSCGQPIAEHDQGVVMTHLRLDASSTEEPHHLDCFLRKILPHTIDCEHCRGRDHAEQHEVGCRYRTRREGGNCSCWQSWLQEGPTG